ncbi:uncharacterized protein N7498_006609, partial [Penicillium cinerascens]
INSDRRSINFDLQTTKYKMYLRTVHAEDEIQLLQQFIHDNPLGVLPTAIKSDEHVYIQSSHIPFILDSPDDSENGILRGHVTKHNPQAKALMEALAQKRAQGSNTLELPDEALKPKPVSGKLVPTWNYSAMQAYGKISVYCDSKAEATAYCMGGGEQPTAWAVYEALDSYVEMLKKNIIGIEVRVERLQGKFKMSQEMGRGDREGVVKGVEALGTEVGEGVAAMVCERGARKEDRRDR